MSNIQIRKYEPKDRAFIRELCFITGDKGRSAASFFGDSELYADLWTCYYTDFEPESIWVAEVDGEPAGYVSCCFRERRFKLINTFYLLPRSIGAALFRGTLFKSYIWKIILLTGFFQAFFDGKYFNPKLNSRCHLHINLKESCRGKNLGQQLLDAACARARELKFTSISAGVRADNSGARNFFIKQAFQNTMELAGFYLPGLSDPWVKAILFEKSL